MFVEQLGHFFPLAMVISYLSNVAFPMSSERSYSTYSPQPARNLDCPGPRQMRRRSVQTIGSTVNRPPYIVTVLGSTSIQRGRGHPATEPLTEGRRQLLTQLVVAAARGLTVGEVDTGTNEPMEKSALRMAIARLRRHLPSGSLPSAVDGRYRLTLPRRDVDLWHLRDLAEGGDLDGTTAAQLSHLLTPRVPAIDCGSERGDDVPHLQVALIARLSRDAPATLDVDLLDKLQAQVSEHPFNEQLLAIAATCLAHSGDRRAAVNLIAAGARNLAEVGLDPSAAIRRLEDALLEGAEIVPGPGPDGFRRPVAIPPALQGGHDIPIVGREQTIENVLHGLDLHPTKAVLLVGPDGSGRTRIGFEVAQSVAKSGHCVAYAGSNQMGAAAFGVFHTAFPTLGTSIAELLAKSADRETQRAIVWGALTAHLDQHLGAHGLLILDDCQWIDSQSAEYLAHAARDTARQWSLLLVGSEHTGKNITWPSLRTLLAQLGASLQKVQPMTEQEMRDLVLSFRSDLSSRQAWGLGSEVHQLTGGRPGPALALLAGDEAMHSRFVRSLASTLGDHLDHLIQSLAPNSRAVGAALSACGGATTAPSLVALVDLTIDDVYAALDELVRSGFAIERSIVDFELRNLETRMAFKRAVLEVRTKELHLRLAGDPAANVHTRAHLLAAAVPLADAANAADCLRASGASHCHAGSHFEACSAYQHADDLHVATLEVEDAWCLSRSLDLVGQRAAAHLLRAASVESLNTAGRYGEALRVATSGLPEAEPLDGDQDLIDLLESIEPQVLDATDRAHLLTHLARQHAIAGHIERAIEVSTALQRHAASPSELFSAAVLRRWVVAAHATASERIRIIGMTEGLVLEPGQQAERHVLRAVDYYELGEHQRAAAEVTALESIGALPAVRHWHRLLFEATFAADRGDLAAAAKFRRQAHQLGLTSGFAEADAALIGAEFVLTRLLGAAFSTTRIDPTPPFSAVTTSVLAEAALALITFDVGDEVVAIEIAEQLVARVVGHPVSGGPGAVALVCPILARSANDRLVSDARGMLIRRGPSMILVGAGAVSLGPAPRYLSQLSTSPSETITHLTEAIRIADLSGSTLWRAIARRDLLTCQVTRAVQRDLRSIVVDTELEDGFRANSG
jgi:AAA ATPase domain/Bacterial transcriptional activator domain